MRAHVKMAKKRKSLDSSAMETIERVKWGGVHIYSDSCLKEASAIKKRPQYTVTVELSSESDSKVLRLYLE